jgi:hypothetical protein
MTQDEAFHCLLDVFKRISREDVDMILDYKYKTDIDYVLKSASPETVYGALHEWAKEKE